MHSPSPHSLAASPLISDPTLALSLSFHSTHERWHTSLIRRNRSRLRFFLFSFFRRNKARRCRSRPLPNIIPPCRRRHQCCVVVIGGGAIVGAVVGAVVPIVVSTAVVAVVMVAVVVAVVVVDGRRGG